MTPHRARWLFALLSKVELPLSPELGSELHSLAMRCVILRSRLDNAENALLPHLNVLITLLEKFFRQVIHVDELVDDE